MPTPRRPTSTRSCPAPQALPAGDARPARRCALPASSVLMHAAGADGWGSMKAQFRRADASGARYRADLRRRRAGARRGRAEAAARRRIARSARVPLADVAAWARDPHRIIAGLPESARSQPSWPPISTSKNRNSSTSSRRSGSSTATSITWVADRRARRPTPAWNGWNWWQRDQGAKAGAMYDELDQAVAGRRRRARGADLRRHEGALSAHRLHAAGRPARRASSQPRRARPTRRAPTLAWVAEQRRPRTSTRPSRACAWPACCSTRRSTTRR